MATSRAAEISAWFESLTPQTLCTISDIYAADAVFIDPFNALSGLAAVRAVYQHMFDTLESPRFVVTTVVAQAEHCFMTWEFLFTLRGREMKISGCTQFELNGQGRILVHRDYWDPAQQLYEKIPVLGGILRALRRKLSLPESAS